LKENDELRKIKSWMMIIFRQNEFTLMLSMFRKKHHFSAIGE